MEAKKKLAAVGLATVIGAAGYGVYATTLNVTNASADFVAGAAAQSQVPGFGSVVINAGVPQYNVAANQYQFSKMTVTPADDSDWTRVSGMHITVTGYDANGNEVVSGKVPVYGQYTTGPVDVPLSAGDANAITAWGIVITD